MKRRSFLGMLICIYLLCYTIGYTKTPNLMQQIGTVSNYRVQLQKETVMVSRDGSTAYAAKDGEILIKPGYYYLTRIKEDGSVKIEQFIIPYGKNQTNFQVQNDGQLEETFKQVLEQKSTAITVQMLYGTYSHEALWDKIKQMLNKVVDTYPALAYVEYSVSSSAGNKPYFTMEITYPLDAKTFKSYDQKVRDMVPKIIQATITPTMKDYEREWALYSYVAKKIVYSKNLNKQMPHTMQGGLVDGIAVCDGYARAMMYLFNSVGIPTTMVTGYADNIPHAWNMVAIQNQWYHVDGTWGDQDEGQIGYAYDYFNESDGYMLKTHTWNRKLTKPANQQMYNFMYMPIELPATYKVRNVNEWRNIKNQLGKDKNPDTTLIFYNQSTEKWDTETLIKQIMAEENTGIQYMINEKYDGMIIQYKNVH